VDIITDLALGEALGYIENDDDTYGLMSTIKQGNMVCQHFSVIHELNTLFFGLAQLPIVKRLVLPSATDKNGLGKIMGVCDHCSNLARFSLTYSIQIIRKAVDQRFESHPAPRQDLLASFLKHGLPRREAEAELVISL